MIKDVTIPFLIIIFTVPANINSPTIKVSNKNMTAVLKKSGAFGTLVRILRIILPLLVP
jgi:hypothetical protein